MTLNSWFIFRAVALLLIASIAALIFDGLNGKALRTAWFVWPFIMGPLFYLGMTLLSLLAYKMYGTPQDGMPVAKNSFERVALRLIPREALGGVGRNS